MTKHFATSAAALFAAAAGLTALSAPASAENQATDRAPTSASSENSGAASERVRESRICVRQEFTGSRMNRRICKTQAEWDAEGGLPTQE